MREEIKSEEEPVMNSNDLAVERTILAENRTLMAWVRTAISMISFGFTIYKFFQETSKNPAAADRIMTPRLVGMTMIIFGMLALIWGLMEHKAVIKKIKRSYPAVKDSKTRILALLILLFGIGMFLGAFFRQ